MSVRRSGDLHQVTALLEHLDTRFELARGERAYPNRGKGDHAMTPTMIDLFCGVGGSSSGAIQVPGVTVRLAANHWRLAARDLIAAVAETLGHDLSDLNPGTHPDLAA